MSRILLRLFLLAVVLGVFILVRDGVNNDPLELQDVDSSEVVAEQEIIPDLVLVPAPGLERETVEVVANPKPQIGTPVEDGLEIQVIDMKTEEPVANAFVLVMDMERMEEDAKTMPDLQKLGMEVLIQRYGIQYPTNKEGRTTIPRGNEKRLFLAAKAEGAFGMRNVNSDSEELALIPIGKNSVLTAHVVDSNGAPAANVNVFLVAVTSSRRNPFLEAKTNAQGLAELRIPAAYLREVNEDSHIAVEAEAYSPLKTSVDVNLHQLPSEPVELKLPPSGKIRILVADTNGKPHKEMCGVRFAFGNHASHDGPADSFPSGVDIARRQVVGGETIFENVGLKTELWVQVSNKDGSFTDMVMAFGPTSEGEVVDVHLALAPVRPVIVGQILDLEGKSVGRAKMNIKIEERRSNGVGYGSTNFKCDEGRFRHALQRPSPKPDSLRVLVIRHEDDKQGTRGEARFDLNNTFPNGETDIGQLQLQPLPLVVSGQIVDSDGSAVAGASWAIEKQGVNGDGELMENHWMNQRNFSGSADDEGKFTIWGYVDDANYRLVVRAAGHTDTKASFEIGQGNLQVVLGGAKDITGLILVDEGISIKSMSLAISPYSQRRGVHRDNQEGVIAADGSFSYPDRGTGSYEIKLTCGKTHEVLADSVAVEVDASAPVAPVVFDLRGQLTQMLVHVVDEDGKPIDRNMLCIPEVAIGRIGTGEASKTILTRRPGMILQVSSANKRTVSLPIIHGEETVVLKEGYPVEVQVTNLDVIPDGYFLAGQLMKADPSGDARKSLWLGDAFDLSDGLAPFLCPDFGDLFIELRLIEIPPEGRGRSRVSLFSGRRIRSETHHTSRLQVQDLESQQSFSISIDEEELTAALEAWRNEQKR